MVGTPYRLHYDDDLNLILNSCCDPVFVQGPGHSRETLIYMVI